MVLGDTDGATCAMIASLDTVRVAPLLAQCVDLDVRLYYAAVQNLVYEHGNVSHTTAESSDTSPLHCAQHVQQSVDMSNQLPTGLQCDPVQMAEVFNRSKYSSAWHGCALEHPFSNFFSLSTTQ